VRPSKSREIKIHTTLEERKKRRKKVLDETRHTMRTFDEEADS